MTARRVNRIGLIGLGKHGIRYARHLRADFPELTLAAVARRDPQQLQRIAAELGAVPYADYRQMFERAELDAVVVVVPPMLHVEIVTHAARAGIPVLLEKPAAPSLAAGAR